jgi:hypothetical protein
MGNGNLFSVFSNQTLILMCLGVGKHRVTVERQPTFLRLYVDFLQPVNIIQMIVRVPKCKCALQKRKPATKDHRTSAHTGIQA